MILFDSKSSLQMHSRIHGDSYEWRSVIRSLTGLQSLAHPTMKQHRSIILQSPQGLIRREALVTGQVYWWVREQSLLLANLDEGINHEPQKKADKFEHLGIFHHVVLLNQ